MHAKHRGQSPSAVRQAGVARLAHRRCACLHWREDGDSNGEPVLILCSLGTDLRLWDRTVAMLPVHVRALRMDMRGHGLSSADEGDWTVRDLVDDALTVLDAAGVRSCRVVGLSIGGMVAQLLAAEHPDRVRAAVLVCTAPVMGTPALWRKRVQVVMRDGMSAVTDDVLERWFAPSFRSSSDVALWRTMLARTPGEGYAACCAALAGADLRADLERITVPVLCVAGSKDGACPPDDVRAMARAIPEARFAILPNVGHLPCVEDPFAFADLVHPFLVEHADG